MAEFVIQPRLDSAVGSGILEIKLLNYYGDGDGSNGHCCDGKFVFCPSACDHKFTICVDNAYGSDSMTDCQFGEYTTGDTIDKNHIVFGDYIGGVRNYFPFKFTQWSGKVKVKVYIVDVDDVNDHDHVDTIRRQIQRKPTRPPRYTAEMIKQRTSLEIDARVSCDDHYYRDDCFVYCKPHDDAINGYYTCNQVTGEKICKQGWTGSSCNVDIDECEETICKNNGTCTNTNGSYSCSCLQGYKGINCEVSPVCVSQPCQNGGNCSETMFLFYNCSCQIGYSGDSCETKVDPCTCSPCNNGGTCMSDVSGNFNCICTSEWIGDYCQDVMPPITPITFFGETTRITLLGTIDDGNREQLADGLRNLSRDLGGVQGRILVQVDTETLELKPGDIITEVNFLVAIDGGKTVISNDQIDAIFKNNKPEKINPYLPLPLYYSNGGGLADPSAIVGIEKERSWLSVNWYVILLVALICLAAVVVFGFVFLRRRRKQAEEKDQIADDFEVQPQNMAFENILYNENNRANANREQAAPPRTPDEAYISTKRVSLPPLPEEEVVDGAVGGAAQPENAYDLPRPINHYQDIDDAKKPAVPGPYLDMNGTIPKRVDNTYQDFNNLAVSMKAIEEKENHYQDLDKVKDDMESLDSLSSDSEDEIAKIKSSFA